jgi:hypothetical protein
MGMVPLSLGTLSRKLVDGADDEDERTDIRTVVVVADAERDFCK